MDHMIQVMNRVQEALASVEIDLDLDLPQIAVIGGQSAGKSSILESLVGRAFLPSGSGVVTRRPLILQLTTSSGREWGEFQHRPGKEFEDFDEIRKEIVRETERVCGARQFISPLPIILRVSSPRVVDLTLIDLPGITRVPVGDQPPDIEQQIRNLLLSFVKNPRCLILAVLVGNADLATADALSVAREVDPGGERTIGVVTKMDLVDHAESLLPVLEGKVYPLKLGFIGVTCRSFRDVQAQKTLNEQAQREEQFFRTHPVFGALAQRSGINYLAQFLNGVLMKHICGAFPEIKALVSQRVVEQEQELESYGEELSKNPGEQARLLFGLVSKFANRFGDAIEGKLSTQPGRVVGRARIDYIFNDVFALTIQNFDATSGLTDNEIRITLQNATGPRASLFVPETAFELLVKRQIAKLESPSIACAELVVEELLQVAVIAEVPEFKRFPKLRARIFGVVQQILRAHLEEASQMIRDLVQIELAYINTSHPDFIGSSGAMRMAKPPKAVDNDGPPVDKVPSKQYLVPPTRTQGTPRSPSATPPAPGIVVPGLAAAGFFSSLFRNQPAGVPAGTPPVRPPSSAPTSPSVPLRGMTIQPRRMSTVRNPSVQLPPVPTVLAPDASSISGRERVEVEIIKNLLVNYVGIVKKNLTDSVKKSVIHFMVNPVKEMIKSECVVNLYKEELFTMLLEESSDIQGRREFCHVQLLGLYRVMGVIGEVRESIER